MLSTEELEKVIDAIDAADPMHEDEILEAIRDTLRFAQGHSGTAEQFIAQYVDE